MGQPRQVSTDCGAIEYEGVRNDHITVVLLRVRNTSTHAVGVAIKHPDDEVNVEIGLNLAEGRALQDLGRQLEREGLTKAGVKV